MVSIIMPVYNADKYLEQAIESVLFQDYVDYELILVDDGSIDQSGQICDKYAQQDERIRVFHKENGGVSSARRYGYDKAKGDWITFMDNDDILAPYFLSSLFEYSENADIIIGRGTNINSEKVSQLKFDSDKFVVGNIYYFSGLHAAELMNTPSDKKYGIVTLLWGKIISREIMEKAILLIDEKKDEIPLNYFEDLFIVPRLLISAPKVIIRDELMYYHRICTDSPSHTMFMKPYNYEQIEVGHINLEYYKENNFIELYKGQLPHYYLVILKIWYACNKFEKDADIKKWCNENVECYYQKYYSHLSKNKYVSIAYRIIIELFKWNKTLWCFIVGDLYFDRLYKYREKIIK